MKKYIDYYKAAKILDDPLQEIKKIQLTRPLTKVEEIMAGTLSVLEHKMYELPFADVRENTTGYWVMDKEESEKHSERIYECSACHNNHAWGTTECTPYCGECGAKMIGVKEDG